MKNLALLTLFFCCIFFTSSAQLPNAGFEEWDSASVVNGVKIYNPVNWYSRNADMVGIGRTSPVSLTKDAHSGSYAIKITTSFDDNDELAGTLSSGSKAPFGDPKQAAFEEKFKLTGRIKSYSAWYKYTPATEMDSFTVRIAFYLRGKAYGAAYFTGGATNVYKQFLWTLTYPDNIEMADSAKFLIFSSKYTGNEGTELILDDIEVQYKTPTGIEDITQPAWSVYPNPAEDKMNLFGIPPKVRAIVVANSQGTVVKEPELTQNSIDVSDLKPGFYWLTLKDEDGNQSTVKFAKQ
ncbi:MAG: T9SS type A sorting domain-containing protein [Bacteroidota bacterium]